MNDEHSYWWRVKTASSGLLSCLGRPALCDCARQMEQTKPNQRASSKYLSAAVGGPPADQWLDLPQVSFLSRQTRLLSQQKYACRDKSMPVATKVCLSRQAYFVAIFVATKNVLVATPASDTRCAPLPPSWLTSVPSGQLPPGRRHFPWRGPPSVVNWKRYIITSRTGVSGLSRHSLRRGGATGAPSSGIPGEIDKAMGDWKSVCNLVYCATLSI